MKKQQEQYNRINSLCEITLCLSFLILIVLILILVNSNGINNSSTISEEGIIKYMKENNITIYGSSKCSYCQKQLKEFKPYETEAITERVFVFCDLTQDTGCIGVTSVPAWKMNDKIVHVGYLHLDEIKNVL